MTIGWRVMLLLQKYPSIVIKKYVLLYTFILFFSSMVTGDAPARNKGKASSRPRERDGAGRARVGRVRGRQPASTQICEPNDQVDPTPDREPPHADTACTISARARVPHTKAELPTAAQSDRLA